MDLAKLTAFFLSAKGRISRKTFWIGVALLTVWAFVVFIVLWTIIGPSLVQTFLGRLVGFPFVLLTIYFAYNLIVKRCHDRERPIIFAQAAAGVAALKSLTDLVRITGGQHANWLDQLFILIGTGIALWLLIDIGLTRGTLGANAYGDDPEEDP